MRTLDDFMKLIRPKKCVYREVPGRYGPWGPARRRYITRTLPDGTVLEYSLPALLEDTDEITPDLAVSILRGLDLRPSDYGY